ncbi:ciliogenesis and planar polarity effector 2 isoform X3 [Loxodonta africana]|uniref:ciliogenesis and planar polarity effector 2 isoform X3 n=1 Tax=Loxodonta africana TaxID=9785 RepID=UPI0030CB29C3
MRAPRARSTWGAFCARTVGGCLGCWRDRCCPLLWPLTLPATRSLCPGRVEWARQRWWLSWLAWRCPLCTTRPPLTLPFLGIQTTVVFWPAKLQATGRVVMFRFEFWDCGESALKKFDHMLPPFHPQACQEKADAFLFLFSFTDRASFMDLPGQLARVAGQVPGAVRIVIGSKFDQYMHTDVPERDLTAFRRAWELPLLRVKSVPGRRLADGRTLDGRAGLADVAHVLNGLAEQLWHQDQVAAGLLPSPPENTPI